MYFLLFHQLECMYFNVSPNKWYYYYSIIQRRVHFPWSMSTTSNCPHEHQSHISTCNATGYRINWQFIRTTYIFVIEMWIKQLNIVTSVFTGHNQSSPPPTHSGLICPLCLECPSHGVNFKKRFNCVNMIMFGAMIVVMGRN